MKSIAVFSLLAVAVVILAVGGWRVSNMANATSESASGAGTHAFQPPPDDAIPKGPFGDEIRMGEAIFREPGRNATPFVGNDLRCSNCHLQAGRLAGASPMWGAWVSFPTYRSKNGHVNSFEERLQGCFRFSMNGKAPKLGDPVLIALETYAYFLAKGLPTGEDPAGRGFPKLPKPAVPADYARGEHVYEQRCASCHGANGLGQSAGGKVVFPPLWGPRSYNWGAGMSSVTNAAEFIRANMPFGLGGILTVQQAWDVGLFIDSQIRPQDPRFVGSVAETRKRFHDTPSSMYGLTVNGAVLGDPATTPPSGTVPNTSASK